MDRTDNSSGFGLRRDAEKQAFIGGAQTPAGCGDKATTAAPGNSLIGDLRRKLWHKAECHERDVAEVRQALDDLNDPLVQKVLNILHLANP